MKITSLFQFLLLDNPGITFPEINFLIKEYKEMNTKVKVQMVHDSCIVVKAWVHKNKTDPFSFKKNLTSHSFIPIIPLNQFDQYF